MANNLYGVIDGIFVARLSEKALTAISLATPIQIVVAALGSGMAIGLNAVISKALGENKREKIKKATSAAIFLALCSYMILFMTAVIFIEKFFKWQTDDVEIILYGVSYLRICLMLSIGCMLQWVFDRLLIATGKTGCFLAALLTASIVNIILDPILIFGLFKIPAMGIAGAALATVIGQMAGAIMSISLNLKFNKIIPIQFSIKPEWSAILTILKVGIPTAFMQGITSIAGVVVNTILIDFSSTAVAIYGIILRVQNIFLVVPHGINLAVIAFISFPKIILTLFQASEYMMERGIVAIQIMSISLFLSIYSYILGTVLQALGKGYVSMILTVARQALFLLPLLLIMRMINNLTLLWLAFPIAELGGMILGMHLKRKYRIFYKEDA